VKINAQKIDTSPAGFATVARIYRAVSGAPPGDVAIDCSTLSWLDANMCAPLGAVLAAEGRNVRLQNVQSQIQTILSKNGFVGNAFAVDTHRTTIRYQRFDPYASAEFEVYVLENFRGKGLPAMSAALERRFRASIFELFENAVAHSQTTHGIFACGQFYPNKKQLHFSLADRGVGIPATVRQYLNRSLTSREAIDWAMSGTNTTRKVSDGVPGGLGLKLIRDFISMNGGSIRVASEDAFWSQDGSQVTKMVLSVPFPGTAVDIEINTADSKMYQLAGEIDPLAIF
jgi:signal transduction histidine kinase